MFSAVRAYQPRPSSRSGLAPLGIENLEAASCNHFLEKLFRRSQLCRISPRKAQAPRSLSSTLSKMAPKSLLGSCPTRPIASGPACGPRPLCAMQSVRHARASLALRAMALRSAGAVSSGSDEGDRELESLSRTSAWRTMPERTAPCAHEATAAWMERGSKAGSWVPLTMASRLAPNISQPAHSTSPTPRASSDMMNTPVGAELTRP
mmetsp:Transcript_80316/g.217533  ORF Transcript_80316/g.217533 Transcript_80316/m.217533 type:complete len:207 (+) Transcript_80316:1205-1825(+)